LLIDKYLKDYHYNEKHEIIINASAKACFYATKNLDISPSLITKLLLRLRGLPYKDASLQDFIKSMCFRYAEEDPYNEFLIDASQNTLKIFWNFYFKEVSPGKTIAGTETRIYCLTPGTKKRFAVYWFFIKPFSGLIRKELLKLVKRSVERSKIPGG
jgi:hypothetical protein